MKATVLGLVLLTLGACRGDYRRVEIPAQAHAQDTTTRGYGGGDTGSYGGGDTGGYGGGDTGGYGGGQTGGGQWGMKAGRMRGPHLAICSEGEILGIALAANETEVDVAQSVVNRLSSSEAMRLANEMITDHGAAAKSITDLATSLGVQPIEDGLAQEIYDQAQQEQDALASLSGAALDTAFVRYLVLAHVAALGTVDHLLLPSSTDDMLTQAIMDGRKGVVGHLRDIVGVQTAMEGACGTPDGDTTTGGGGGGGTDTGGGYGGGSSGGGSSGGGSSGGGSSGGGY